ncbi:MAG: DUF2935 domain-containing protein [Clostridiales bacterium]|jgi:hypothetical protein|nr:DUF2935 domain-containing protein [Clostridiales bacterium]
MISSNEYIKQSLALHLFFARIMKEHSFFLQVGFTAKDNKLIEQANNLRTSFDAFLREVVALSNGVVDPGVLQSGEVVTPYTQKAEMISSNYTGVNIPLQLTQSETRLQGNPLPVDSQYERRVNILNENAIRLINSIIRFKTNILTNVLSCRLFTVNYPLLIDHILREARLYLSMVQRLQRRERINVEQEELEQEHFWNRIMAEHSKFIRGLLDPTEEELIMAADNFADEFDQLTQEAKQAIDRTIPISNVTEDSLNATREIRNFNTQGTQGLIECRIKSIIIPLLGDHVLRESNHYLRLLNMFKQG